MKLFSSKKRVAAIGALTAVTLVGGGMAYGYWTTTGTGTGSATTGTSSPFTVVAQANDAATAGALSPGGPTQTASFKVRNTGTGQQKVNQVVVTVAESDGTAWTAGASSGCTADDFILGGESPGIAHTITVDEDLAPATNSTTQSVTVQMWNNPGAPQDDCKGVTVPLHYAVS